MKQNIWIINHYASDTYFERGGRHYWIAKYLRKMRYNVTIFCCNNKHNASDEKYFDTKELYIEKKADEIDTPFVFVAARGYCGNGLDRIMNMLAFYRNVKKTANKYIEKNGVPDVIIASSVHPFTLLAGIQIARQHKVKCICEIRDLWPESLVAYGIAGKYNPFVVTLRVLEKWIYKKADHLIFTMEGAYEYIKSQKWEKTVPEEKVSFINNGVDLEEFNENVKSYILKDKDLLDKNTFKVVYAGSIRKANNIGRLIDAAKLLDCKNVRFLIWGSGGELEELRKRVADENINNVIFKGRVDKRYIPFILSHSDANFLDPFVDAISKYGISSNKLFEYFAAGRPILMNEMHNYIPGGESDCKFYYSDTPESIMHALNTIVELSKDDYLASCNSAKHIAERYSFDQLTNSLTKIIEEEL
ncbi:MAG: glycosyltransferase family 4 protein [Mogibacterium sp.]|nr:glycosyltransferase family 4 protein [Mogibacterium sp.]